MGDENIDEELIADEIRDLTNRLNDICKEAASNGLQVAFEYYKMTEHKGSFVKLQPKIYKKL